MKESLMLEIIAHQIKIILEENNLPENPTYQQSKARAILNSVELAGMTPPRRYRKMSGEEAHEANKEQGTVIFEEGDTISENTWEPEDE